MKDALEKLEQLFYTKKQISEKEIFSLFDSSKIPEEICWRTIYRMVFDVGIRSRVDLDPRASGKMFEPVMKDAIENIRTKNFSETALLKLIREYNRASTSLCHNHLKDMLDDLDNLTNEYKNISTKNQKKIKTLESETVKTMTADLTIKEKVKQIKAKFKKTMDLFQRDLEKLENISITDHLTGLYNRRFFDERFKEETFQALDEKTWLSLLMIDIDDFKQFNDTYGHSMGDQALRFVARNIQMVCHDESNKSGIFSLPTRYGGEEFAVILPAVDKKQARETAEEICEKIGQYSFVIRNQKGDIKHGNLNLTVSIGLAEIDHKWSQDAAVKAMIENADVALYEAKKAGKNCVKTY